MFAHFLHVRFGSVMVCETKLGQNSKTLLWSVTNLCIPSVPPPPSSNEVLAIEGGGGLFATE